MDLESKLVELAEPIAPDRPCGESLEDTSELAAFDAYRIFGLLTAPANEPDWREMQARALATLEKSKDLRVLAHLAAATLRTEPLPEALRVFPLIETWLTRYWDDVHPRLDGDAIMRRNALSDFADRVAILDAIRRRPLVTHPLIGAVSLRDIDIATGAQPNPDPEVEPRNEAQIAAALKDADPAAVSLLCERAAAAAQSLSAAQEIMRTRGGDAAVAPQVDLLCEQLSRIRQLLEPRILDSERTAADGTLVAAAPAEHAVSAVAGVIRTRQDAISALDAVASYFRKNEPSSPVPLIVERARRLISMSFLEVVADLAPDALEQARRAAGVREP